MAEQLEMGAAPVVAGSVRSVGEPTDAERRARVRAALDRLFRTIDEEIEKQELNRLKVAAARGRARRW